mmetsp:Transcript_7639/g.16349  ORF Transcript_7639/g.16349 Transcript_7639/m.16349 type:complete len:110 (-) Transcript_7639:21-350(-)
MLLFWVWLSCRDLHNNLWREEESCVGFVTVARSGDKGLGGKWPWIMEEEDTNRSLGARLKAADLNGANVAIESAAAGMFMIVLTPRLSKVVVYRRLCGENYDSLITHNK